LDRANLQVLRYSRLPGGFLFRLGIFLACSGVYLQEADWKDDSTTGGYVSGGTGSARGIWPAGVASFEVASVKPVTPEEQSGQPIGLFTYPGGRIRATNCTLRMLIHHAYGVEMNQIVGGPTWIDSDRYVIEGKGPVPPPSGGWVPESLKTPPNPMRQMLQSLLYGRCELRLQRELKTESVYALVVAKGGPKLKAPKDATPQPFVSFGRTGLRRRRYSRLLSGRTPRWISRLCGSRST
jgi:hypothetical protein